MSHLCPPPCDAAVIRAARQCSPCQRRTGRWVLAATIIGSSMAFVDGTVVNVALPVLQAELGATVAELQWIIESYMLFLAALILVGGMLGDQYGRRRIFGLGVTLFGLASIWCGLSPDPLQLIIARGVQGIGGALLIPGSLAIISSTFSEEQRGRAIGTWAAFTALAMAFGPVLGGWLVDNVSWRWIFFINIPPALVVLWILRSYVPESSRSAKAARLDWPGAFLSTVGLGVLVFALIEAGASGFGDWAAIGGFALGGFLLVGFIVVERRSPAPMLPLTLFRSRMFSGANLVTLLLYAALSGGLFFFPFNLIQVQGYSTTATGAAFLPFVFIMFVLSRWSGGLVTRYGGRLPLTVGPAIAAVGFVLFTLPGIGGSYWATFFPATAVLGLGMAITVAPLTTVVMGAVEVERAGVASGINNAVSRVAGLIAIAVMSVVVSITFNDALDGRVATLDLGPAVQAVLEQERIKLAGAEIPASVGVEVAALVERVIAESYISSFRIAMFIAAALALAGAFGAALTIRGKAAQVASTA
ncbi:MAG: MFS transporter [Alphaproteobacteria bacterium]